MNPKTKMKVMIDIAMTGLFLILMNLALTGVLWHEVIGIGILGLFVAHLAVNRQWIASIARNFSKKIGGRAKAMFVLNAVLLAAMLATIGSGVLISQYLFPFLASASISLWLSVHTVSSWLTLAILAAHTLVHWRWIANLLKRLTPAGGIRVLVARASLAIMATAAIYSFINNDTIAMMTASNSASQSSASDVESVSVSGTTDAAVQETLQEFLSKLTCTACGKHCPLTSPRCAKGQAQVEAATETYNSSLSVHITYEL